MNLLEKYSSSCGVKISKPDIGISYFPHKFDKYIVIDNTNKNGMNVYDLYSDVIAYIHPVLKENNIDIVSFCKDNRSVIEKTNPYISLEKKQEAYLLQNSLLNICSDNLSSYVSSALDVPCISLYSIFPSNVSKPIWSDKLQVIESDRCGNLPFYGGKEDPKSINFIPPEQIANNIFKSLNLKSPINHETIFIGDLYPVKVVEVIPNFVADKSFLKGRALNLRMDYHFDENNACHWISGRKVNLLTDKKINIKILEYFKSNIAQFTISINDDFDEEYLKQVQEIGIQLEIFCEDKSKIQDFRFKFFDFDVNESIWKSKDDAGDKVAENTKFLTSKVILSEGKKYSCYEAYLRKKELTGNPESVYDSEDFWKELDHYRLINERI